MIPLSSVMRMSVYKSLSREWHLSIRVASIINRVASIKKSGIHSTPAAITISMGAGKHLRISCDICGKSVQVRGLGKHQGSKQCKAK